MSVGCDCKIDDEKFLHSEQLQDRQQQNSRISSFEEGLQRAAGIGSILEVEHILNSVKDDEDLKRSILNFKDTSRGWTPLHAASVSGYAEVCKLLIDNHCDVNSLDKLNKTALHWASRFGHAEVVKLLLENYCDANLTNVYNHTALYLASDAGHTEVVSQLLQYNCNLNHADEGGRTALHRAAFQGHVEVVKLLVSKNCELDLQDDKGWTALHLAAYKRYTEVVRVLVEAGALLDLEESLNRTALYFSARREGVKEMTDILLAKGAKFTAKQLNTALNLTDVQVIDTLMSLKHLDSSTEWARTVVCGSNNPSLRFQTLKRLSRMCLRKFNKVDENATSSILGLACKNNLIDIVKFLAKKYPDDINTGTPTPLWHAANGGHEKVLKFLANNFKRKINLKATAPDGTTPLMIVIGKEYFDLLPYFATLYGNSKFTIIQECVKFGKYGRFRTISGREISRKPGRPQSRLPPANKLTFDKQELEVLMREAVMSDCIKTYKFVSTLLKRHGLDKHKFTHLVEKRQNLQMRLAAGANTQFQNSPLINMSHVYPVFNAAVEHKWTNGVLAMDGLVNISKDISQRVLKQFCCLANSDSTFEVSKMELTPCEENCNQTSHCHVIRHLLKAAQRLEQKLLTSCRVMQYLHPQFHLIGSIPEATRMGIANEADITMKFVQAPFRLGKNNTEMLLPDNDEARIQLKDYIKEETVDTFDYASFLAFLLMTLESCFKEVDLSDLSLEVVKWNQDFQPCDDCQAVSYNDAKSIYQPLMHCANCLPLVTHSKLGPCLVLRQTTKEINISLHENDPESFIVTIDLIPVFPFSEADAERAFASTIKTLVEERPSGWLDHFNSIMKKDILLPDVFNINQKSECSAVETLNGHDLIDEKTVHYVAIKLLHHGPEPNYIIRPGQRVQIEEFGSNEVLKSIYIHMKALRDLLNADLKSFFMKKVVLFPEFIANFVHINDHLSRIGLQDPYRGKGQKEIDTEGFRIFNSLLFEAMSHVDVKHAFEDRIDYDLWADNIAKKVFVGKIPIYMAE